VEGWKGPRLATFRGDSHLPLRGGLRLYFLSAEEFRSPRIIIDPEDRDWVLALLERIRDGYQVVFEQPSDFVRRVIEGDESIFVSPPPHSGSVQLENPLRLPKEVR
jgi:hypothetical protein